MPKLITNDVRQVVLKVKEYFIKEKELSKPVIAFEKVNERVAAATGVSIRTVTRISSERIAEASSSKLVTSGQKRKINNDKLLLDDSDSGILQRKKKKKETEVNIVKTSSAKPEMVENSFEAMTTDEWGNYCSHVIKIEEEDLDT